VLADQCRRITFDRRDQQRRQLSDGRGDHKPHHCSRAAESVATRQTRGEGKEGRPAAP
jgi:hypothetical protein